MKVEYYVKRYLNGDGESFNQIYELTKKDVYLSIYIYFREKMIIDDLMQDTYMKVIDKIDSYQLGTNFHAWISKIARNIAINHYNKTKREDLIDPIEEKHVYDKEESSNKVNYYMSFLDGIEKDVYILRILLGYKFDYIDEILSLKRQESYYIYKKLIKKLETLV